MTRLPAILAMILLLPVACAATDTATQPVEAAADKPTADDTNFTWALLRAASMSVARLSLCQFQDVLELGSAHRMNVPGTTSGCWTWRFSWDWVKPEASLKLAHMSAASARVGFERLDLPA